MELQSRESSEAQIGSYIPIRSLGEGTTGKVKLAMPKDEPDNTVAIKVIDKSRFLEKSNLEKKVQREISLMRLVKHPNILKLTDVFESEKHLYIVLEYAKQGELFDYLISNRTIPEDQALDFFRQIILAIEYLHHFGICHRDLKPENILLDSCFRIKIADFGFARWTKNVADTSCGSPHYAAPEVISGKPYDGRKADIWSCGVILYALLAGFLPFDDASIKNLLHKVKRGIYFMPNFPDYIKDIIERMLTVNPEQRITIEEIKKHKCFTMNLLPNYVLPTPLPLYNTSELKIENLSPENFADLEKIGFLDRDELAQELSSDTHNLAKVFVSMLFHSDDYENLPWDDNSASPSSATLIEHGDFMKAKNISLQKQTDDPFKRRVIPPSESLPLTMMSVADQNEWGVAESKEPVLTSTIETFGMTIWNIMYYIQQLLNERGMQWFHPDLTLIIARKEDTNTYIRLEGEFRNQDDIIVNVSLYKGDVGDFEAFCNALKQTISTA